jgi:hypothetical protein
VERVTRDLVFIDQRYVVLRDRVVLAKPGKISWLLHAETNLNWDAARSVATIRGAEGKATATAQLLTPGAKLRGAVTNEFPVPVDPKYAKAENGSPYITGSWHNQAHFTAESTEPAKDFTIYTVIWPERGSKPVAPAASTTTVDVLTIKRPDGKTDVVTLNDTTLTVR